MGPPRASFVACSLYIVGVGGVHPTDKPSVRLNRRNALLLENLVMEVPSVLVNALKIFFPETS